MRMWMTCMLMSPAHTWTFHLWMTCAHTIQNVTTMSLCQCRKCAHVNDMHVHMLMSPAHTCALHLCMTYVRAIENVTTMSLCQCPDYAHVNDMHVNVTSTYLNFSPVNDVCTHDSECNHHELMSVPKVCACEWHACAHDNATSTYLWMTCRRIRMCLMRARQCPVFVHVCEHVNVTRTYLAHTHAIGMFVCMRMCPAWAHVSAKVWGCEWHSCADDNVTSTYLCSCAYEWHACTHENVTKMRSCQCPVCSHFYGWNLET